MTTENTTFMEEGIFDIFPIRLAELVALWEEDDQEEGKAARSIR